MCKRLVQTLLRLGHSNQSYIQGYHSKFLLQDFLWNVSLALGRLSWITDHWLVVFTGSDLTSASGTTTASEWLLNGLNLIQIQGHVLVPQISVLSAQYSSTISDLHEWMQQRPSFKRPPSVFSVELKCREHQSQRQHLRTSKFGTARDSITIGFSKCPFWTSWSRFLQIRGRCFGSYRYSLRGPNQSR